MRITRRHLQLCLALLWLLDGALQFQPYMFSADFAHKILMPASMGQPVIVALPMHAVTSLVAAYPVPVNGIFATIQVGLGIALLSRRFARPALAASIVWALSVWFVGEGLGGIVAGSTALTGAPGAALLYAVVALLAWPSRDPHADLRPPRFAIAAWSALWVSAAGLQLIGGNNSGSTLSQAFRDGENGAPSWIAGIDHHLSVLDFPNSSAAILAALFLLVGLWVLVPGRARGISIGIGITIALVAWMLVQGFGDLTSGQATDPNSGPLIALLGCATLSASRQLAPIRGASSLPPVSSERTYVTTVPSI
jgi:hypothetical protein